MFDAAGWQVITLKYGRCCSELFERPGGDALRARIDAMTNPEYQRLLRCDAAELRRRLPGDGDRSAEIAALVEGLDDQHAVVRGRATSAGTTSAACSPTPSTAIDDARPTVIFAYTVKGYGLPTEGHPQNHSALLTEDQMRAAGRRLGADLDDPWAPFADGSPEAELCRATAERLRRPPVPRRRPLASAHRHRSDARTARATTQAALGRTLLDLTRAAPEAAARVVTVSPDVSSSTNLGGWVNKVGVWSPTERQDWFADDGETILHWRERPTGQHIELGIAEVNLVRAARGARRDLEPVGRAAAARSAWSTTRSSVERSSRGRSGCTPAASRSSSARPQG